MRRDPSIRWWFGLGTSQTYARVTWNRQFQPPRTRTIVETAGGDVDQIARTTFSLLPVRLWQQIEWLDENRKITSAQRSWADAARWVGNHGAHDTEPDVASGQPAISSVTAEDAAQTVTLVEHLFETLYVASKLAEAQILKHGKPKA